jgi:Raf kinase inhibitor-like YbhB/YbcL family protein
MHGDGSLLMADDANGVIYRVAYTGSVLRAEPSGPTPAGPMKAQAEKGVGVALAGNRPEAQPKAAGSVSLRVESASFAQDAPIPLRHSEYAEGVSPWLTWSAVPGARSYVLIAEDPDAKPITPYVHWVAWNIPVTTLPEGLQKNPRLTVPEGLMQGKTSRGSIGYLGPRPPVGDPPHHYHFQVFALDTLLDLPPGAERDQVLAAMRGHVLAKGVLVGQYQQLQAPLK